jgi:ketosteroid isomerase-like protein
MSHENVATIQAIYGAFGRGDVPAILERVTDTTRWDFAGGNPEVPWHHPVAGRAELLGFFQAFGANVDIQVFEPREFMHCGPHVVVDVHLEYTVRKSDRRVVMDQLHWWTLDAEGRVGRRRHYEDTAQVLAAVRG